ncbi:MAG: hypothetical protein V9E93_00435 [Steroidobacteraceae bacterium]
MHRRRRAGDAQRLLDKVRNRIKTDDERAWFAEVDAARIALERGNAARALGIAAIAAATLAG